MHYELGMGRVAAAWMPRVCERRSGYRRNWYAEQDDRGDAGGVTVEAEQRVRRAGGRARQRHMLELSRRLAETALPEPARRDFLELEEALHAHWLALAIEHYNLGVEAGLGKALVTDATRELPARDRLRALADALRSAIDEL